MPPATTSRARLSLGVATSHHETTIVSDKQYQLGLGLKNWTSPTPAVATVPAVASDKLRRASSENVKTDCTSAASTSG